MPHELRAVVLRVLGTIAPEADLASLRPDLPFVNSSISIRWTSFVVGLQAAVGVETPEADYPKLATLDACVEYLASRR